MASRLRKKRKEGVEQVNDRSPSWQSSRQLPANLDVRLTSRSTHTHLTLSEAASQTPERELSSHCSFGDPSFTDSFLCKEDRTNLPERDGVNEDARPEALQL